MKRSLLTSLALACPAFPGLALAAASPDVAPAVQPAPAPPAFHLDVNEAIGQIGSGFDLLSSIDKVVRQ